MPKLYPRYGRYCLICSKLLLQTQKNFCSKKCKSVSQIVKISLTCNCCGKEFLQLPCRKRNTNYCSVRCCLDSTRIKQERICKACGSKFIANGSQIRHGFGIYCSRRCQHETYPKRVKKSCPRCQKEFMIPPSWVPTRTFCCKKCQNDSMRDYVKSICRKCKKVFELPRSDFNRGRGNFCTYRCFLKYRGPSILEEKMEKALNLAHINFEREIKFGRFHADFLLEKYKTIIECDGEYWHLLPKMQKRDRRKDNLLHNLGYKVLRFSGTQINKYSEKVLARQLNSEIFSH